MALKVAAFVVPLGIDTFAVAVVLGLRGVSPLRPALVFACFETAMPLLGIGVGNYVARRWEHVAVYAGAAILVAIGLHVIRETLRDDGAADRMSLASARGIILAGLGVSTDEIAMGFPLGALDLPVGPVLLALGVQTFLATTVGILIGGRISSIAGRRASRTAGVAAGIAFVLLGCYVAVT